MAISGYCDCWTGSIDVGEGKCDMQAYIAVEKTNKVLVSATSSVSYLAIITGAVTANGFAPILTIMYQQTYANFYYLNSSAVLQTDDVLSQY